MQVTVGALYSEAIPANGITMRAARNECHVVSGRSHPPAEIAPDGTRCHDRHPHVVALRSFVLGACLAVIWLEAAKCPSRR
jgi:hypothetical protein